MTRPSDWKSPSRDLITRESFADQSFLVTTRAPRPLMFSVKVNSVLDTQSGLVSITATAVALLFSYRPGCISNRTVKPTAEESAERLLRMPSRFVYQGLLGVLQRTKRLGPPLTKSLGIGGIDGSVEPSE